MPESRETHRRQMAAHRQTRRERGLVETNVWMTKPLREAIDRRVEAGHYMTRAHAISSALEAFFKETPTTT